MDQEPRKEIAARYKERWGYPDRIPTGGKRIGRGMLEDRGYDGETGAIPECEKNKIRLINQMREVM